MGQSKLIVDVFGLRLCERTLAVPCSEELRSDFFVPTLLFQKSLASSHLTGRNKEYVLLYICVIPPSTSHKRFLRLKLVSVLLAHRTYRPAQ